MPTLMVPRNCGIDAKMPFNSLFEMQMAAYPTHMSTLLVLSILYLRCTTLSMRRARAWSVLSILYLRCAPYVVQHLLQLA